MIIETFEHLLSSVIRPFGLWQLIIYCQLGFVQFFFAAVNVSVIFFQIRPEYACDVYSNSTWTINEMLQIRSVCVWVYNFDKNVQKPERSMLFISQ